MDDKKKMYYGWKIVAVGFLIMGLVYSMASTTGVFLIPVTEGLGINRAQFSICSVFAAAGFVAGSAIMGNVFKKHKIKNVMIMGCLVICADLFAKSAATQLWQLCLCDLIMGIAYAAASIIPIPLLINNWFGIKKRGLANSLALAGSGIGSMIMTVLLNAVIQSYGWRWGYRCNMLLILLIIIPLIYFVVVSTPGEKGLKKLGEAENSVNEEKETSGLLLSEARRTGYFWMVLIAFLFAASAMASISSNEISYLNDIGFSPAMAANMGAIGIGSLTVGKILLGSLCDRLGLKAGTMISSFLLMLSIIALYLTSFFPASIYIHVLCYCIGGSMATVGVPLAVAWFFGNQDYSRFLGILNAMTGLGLPIGTVLGGVLFTVTGSYASLWILMGIASLICMVFMFLSFGIKSRESSR